MNEPHTRNVNVSEPHTRNVNVSEPHTRNVNVSEPHTWDVNVSEPHTRNVNVSSGVAKAGPGRARARLKAPCSSRSCHAISCEARASG